MVNLNYQNQNGLLPPNPLGEEGSPPPHPPSPEGGGGFPLELVIVVASLAMSVVLTAIIIITVRRSNQHLTPRQASCLVIS